ncbi:MAG TPA: YfiR family protein [Candidatus Limnocylindria bacterium]|nr:YfiR family protein [Candidatus Limnocylindria bacterium]
MKYKSLIQKTIFALLLGSAMISRAVAQSEDAVKAAFLYNFAKFVEWPASAFADGNAPLVVAFIGGGSLADTFEQNVKGKNANGREFSVKKLSSASGAESAQIVVIADGSQTGAATGAVKGKPVLTVADVDGAATAIHFVKDGAKMGFDLDLDVAKGAGLKVDPKLQKVAKSVKGG